MRFLLVNPFMVLLVVIQGDLQDQRGNFKVKFLKIILITNTNRPLGYERVSLPIYKVADTPFHIQGDEISTNIII